MSQDYGDWDDLGRNIQEIIDRAVNSRDYQKLNQTVSQIIGRAVDRGSEAVRKAMDASARSAAAPRCRQEPAPGSAQNIARLYGSTGNQTAAGILKAAGGGILTLCMLPTFLSLLIASWVIKKAPLRGPAVMRRCVTRTSGRTAPKSPALVCRFVFRLRTP